MAADAVETVCASDQERYALIVLTKTDDAKTLQATLGAMRDRVRHLEVVNKCRWNTPFRMSL